MMAKSGRSNDGTRNPGEKRLQKRSVEGATHSSEDDGVMHNMYVSGYSPDEVTMPYDEPATRDMTLRDFQERTETGVCSTTVSF